MSKINRSLKVLSLIIKRLEDDTDFIDKLEAFLVEKESSYAPESPRPVSFDIFDEFIKSGRQGLEPKLASLDEMQLKMLIKEHSLDSKKLAQKWKNKERLIALVLDRVESRVEKGNIFLNFGKDKPVDS